MSTLACNFQPNVVKQSSKPSSCIREVMASSPWAIHGVPHLNIEKIIKIRESEMYHTV
jgi:hypothetical protein